MTAFRSAQYLLLSLLLLLMPISPVSAGPDLQEGEWEFTSQTDMQGMPMTVPPMSFHQCMSDEQAIPQQEGKNPDCTMLEQRTSGNTLHWKMRCEYDYGRTDIKGSVSYSGSSMTGITHISSDQGGQNMNMTTRMQGKRIGPCK